MGVHLCLYIYIYVCVCVCVCVSVYLYGMWQDRRKESNSLTSLQLGKSVGQCRSERSDLVTLDENEATRRKKNKDIGNDEAFLVSRVRWNTPESTRKFDEPEEGCKNRLRSQVIRSLESLVRTQNWESNWICCRENQVRRGRYAVVDGFRYSRVAGKSWRLTSGRFIAGEVPFCYTHSHPLAELSTYKRKKYDKIHLTENKFKTYSRQKLFK